MLQMRAPHSRFSRREFVYAAAGFISAGSLAAQQQPTFSTAVKVVNVLAVVRDKNGSLVRGLGKDDFTLFENDRPQAIRYFSRESDLPLTIGLLIDTSLSQRTVLDEEISATSQFLETVLRENKDNALIVQFDRTILLRQNETFSRKELEASLRVLDTPDPDSGPGGTLLYDAIRFASTQKMLQQAGRKAVIILSDGVDNGSHITLSDAIDAAERSDTLVYGILFSDEYAYGKPSRHAAAPPGRPTLEKLAQQTGGGFFQVSKRQTIQQTFSQIEEELRNEYSLGYISDQPVAAPGFRNIRLETKKKGLAVQARHRYYAEP